MRVGALMIAAVCALTATATAEQRGQDQRERGQDREERRQDGDERGDRGGDSYFHRRGYARLDIPAGHYPPPGECRVWLPGRPPGHQPPPGSCRQLRHEVPPGGWLIRHPGDRRDHVYVDVYDEHRRGAVLVTGEFRIGSGVFVRMVVDR